MSKKTSILIVLFASICVVQEAVCQTSISLYVPACGYTSEEAVGRVSSDGNHIISSHHHMTYSEFFWSDPTSGTGYKFMLQNGMFVSDFELMGDTVFFCGYDGGTRKTTRQFALSRNVLIPNTLNNMQL